MTYGKFAATVAAAALCVALGACGTTNGTASDDANQSGVALDQSGTAPAAQGTVSSSTDGGSLVQVRTSTDKHVAYMKNYVGMNAANIGYTSLSEQRYDDYGNGRYLNIVFVTPDGSHVDFLEDDEQLKEWKVSAQSIAPDTEMAYTFQLDSDGEEYDNLVAFKSISQVVLAVDKVGESGNAKDMTKINDSPDQYSCYMRDYRERNLVDCGYESLGGDLVDDYGGGCYIHFDIVTDDGSYADPSDRESLAQFKVTAQSVDPNTQIGLTRSTDSSGQEYANIVADQTIDSITLYATRLSE